jgi:predicted nucleic acid-binding protein
MLFPSYSRTTPFAPAYQAILAGGPLAVSLITLAEIEHGMEAKNWGGSRRDLMRRFLARFTVLSPDPETARMWARFKSGCEKKGRPIAFADAWIAAAAVQLNVPLATHNASDFRSGRNCGTPSGRWPTIPVVEYDTLLSPLINRT